MIKLLAGLLLISVLPLFSDPVSYSSTCSSYGVPVVTGASSCMENPLDSRDPVGSSNYTYASTQVNINLGLSNEVMVTQSLIANIDALTAPSTRDYGYGTSSQSQASYSTTLTTLGSGGGFVHVTIPAPYPNISVGAAPGSGGVSQVSITGAALIAGYSLISGGCQVYFDLPQSQSCNSGGPGPLGSFFGSYYFANYAPYIPIQLGVPFTLNVAATASALGDPVIEEANGAVSNYLDFQFQVVGSDLKTPVEVEAVPEPSTISFLGVGLASAAGWLLRRRF